MIVIPMFLAVPSTIFMAGSMLVQFRSGSLISAISCTGAPKKGKLRWLSPCDIVSMHARRDSYDARRIIAGGHYCQTPMESTPAWLVLSNSQRSRSCHWAHTFFRASKGRYLELRPGHLADLGRVGRAGPLGHAGRLLEQHRRRGRLQDEREAPVLQQVHVSSCLMCPMSDQPPIF